MALYEQLPGRGYPGRGFPGRMLAHGGAEPLGMEYPGGEQIPTRGYPLGAFPLQHLARITTGADIGLEYPDCEQRPKRSYPLGAHPLWHLARCGAAARSRGKPFQYPRRHDDRPRIAEYVRGNIKDDREFLELMALLSKYL